ncbi:MAG: aldo/keto reductase [Spirochaetales bacterium]|nr:aldo/keto reductase [Spirochaetales bacterium]
MKRRLGRMGIETSALGMGCWAIGGEWSFLGTPAGWGKTDDAESVRAIRAAYDHGIRVFDTAANYGTGLSERLVAEGLAGHRNECVISTKFGFEVDEEAKEARNRGADMRTMPVAEYVQGECEASLRRLKTDYIDIYFFHVWDYDNALAVDVTEALERLVEQGKIRSYGWSTDSPESAAVFADGAHCSAIQTNFSIAVDQPEILSLCEKRDMAAFNRGPLAMGFLTGKYGADTTFSATDVRNGAWVKDMFQGPISATLDTLREILTSGGRTLAQGALAYIWARSATTLPIPGIRTVAQAEENAKAMEAGPLAAEEAAEIDRIMGRP